MTKEAPIFVNFPLFDSAVQHAREVSTHRIIPITMWVADSGQYLASVFQGGPVRREHGCRFAIHLRILVTCTAPPEFE
jgi:hypothetical protein